VGPSKRVLRRAISRPGVKCSENQRESRVILSVATAAMWPFAVITAATCLLTSLTTFLSGSVSAAVTLGAGDRPSNLLHKIFECLQNLTLTCFLCVIIVWRVLCLSVCLCVQLPLPHSGALTLFPSRLKVIVLSPHCHSFICCNYLFLVFLFSTTRICCMHMLYCTRTALVA